jgi:nucleotide-binding universal stress UspA family protein
MFKRIVCATDFSDTAEAAWELATELGRTHQAALVLVHVFIELPVYPEVAVASIQRVWEEQRRWAEEQLAERIEVAAGRGLAARYLLRTGTAPEEIVRTATDEHADLVVVGTHGRTGLDRLMIGSVAERVVRVAPCPVLTVKPRPAAKSARAAA